MKNTTKKILSLILAVIMLFSVMPVAYAAEKATFTSEQEQYIDIWMRILSYGENKYAGGYQYNGDKVNNDYDKVFEIINGAYREVYAIVGKDSEVPLPVGEDFENMDLNNVYIFNTIMQPAIDEVEAKIASGEIQVIVNVYEFTKYYYYPLIRYGEEAIDSMVDEFQNSEKYAAMCKEANNGIDEIFRRFGDPDENITQAEFDAIWEEKITPFYDMIYNCLDGKHNFIKKDGTNTFVCDFCGAEIKATFIKEYARRGAYFEFCSYAEGREEAQRYTKLNFDENTLQDILRSGKENDTEKMLSYTEIFKEKNAEIEKAIDDGKLTVIIDGYYVALLECKVFFYSDYLEYDINGKPLYIYERNAELFNEADEAYQKANNILGGGTQEEYDAAIKKWVDAYSLGLEHVFGEHDFNEYISNNDATEDSDGTKTATCEFCGATDIVIDEGSKLESDNSNNNTVNCSCNCHKGGFMGFIWKILTFFYKIFGTNKICTCGVAHY